jgi:hypothetical protein
LPAQTLDRVEEPSSPNRSATRVAVVPTTPARARLAALIFRTSDSPFDPGVNNQGWWSETVSAYDGSDNYVTGFTSTAANYFEVRNFFTFDLRALDLTGRTIVSAVLQLDRGVGWEDPTETLTLFDVSTDAATLNDNTGINAAIFDDLGTGTEYGTYVVRAGASGRVAFRLDQAAIADITAAAGGFFSIGGTLQSPPGFLFGYTAGGDQRLVLCLDTDPDGDGDGVCDSADNCPAAANPEQDDLDGDEIGDACDDSDGDGVVDSADNCPFAPNPGQEDADGDGLGNACDICTGPGQSDCDGDGICNPIDNCVCWANPDQADGDGDGFGDTCDNCPTTSNPDQANADGDSLGDACDLCPSTPDFDADNVCDDVDNCPRAYNPGQEDADGNGRGVKPRTTRAARRP